MDKIDFVVTWVNGADKKWQSKRAKFDSGSVSEAGMSSDKAYRDWELLTRDRDLRRCVVQLSSY